MSNLSTLMAAKAVTSKIALSQAEVLNLLQMSKSGDKSARGKLLEANLGLIYKIANEVKIAGVEFSDVVADGCVRFLEIIDDYDPIKATLSTYLWNPLLQYMNRRIPGFSYELKKFVAMQKSAEKKLTARLGRRPLDDEMACEMGISLLVYKNRTRDLIYRSPISCDEPISGDGDSDCRTIRDSFIAKGSGNVFDCEDGSYYDSSSELIREEERRCIKESWEKLSEQEKEILRLRYPENGKKVSLRDVEERTGIGRETFRKREMAAKKHLKDNLESLGLQVA